MPARILESDRLTLRNPTLWDAPFFAALPGDDPDALRMMSAMPIPCTTESARHWIAMRIGPGGHVFAVTRRTNGEFMGAIGLHGLKDTMECGDRIGRPYWRQGFAPEATGLRIDHSRVPGVHTVPAATPISA